MSGFNIQTTLICYNGGKVYFAIGLFGRLNSIQKAWYNGQQAQRKGVGEWQKKKSR